VAIPPPSRIAPLTVMPGVGPDWYKVALYQKQLWDNGFKHAPANEIANFDEHVTWDEAYFNACPFFGGRVHNIGDCHPRQADWCSAFVNYCLHRAGYCHTGHGYARSFLNHRYWSFKALAEPQVGCVIVVGLGAHVGFLAATDGLPSAPRGNVRPPEGGFMLLGGNQSGRITFNDNESRVLTAATDRYGNRSPYLLPIREGGNCNMGISTAAPHRCGYPHHG